MLPESYGITHRIGRLVPEADRDDVRELILQGYRIIYRVLPECVEILAVIHGSRNLAGEEIKPWESLKNSDFPPAQGCAGKINRAKRLIF